MVRYYQELVSWFVVRHKRMLLGSAMVLGVLLFSLTQPFVPSAQAQRVRDPHTQPNYPAATAGTTSHLHTPPQAQLPAVSSQVLAAQATSEPVAPGGGETAPINVTLDPAKDTHVTSSDGKLEILVPAAAISAPDVAAVGGAIQLHATEIAPASGASAGGSGIVTFGTYLLQLTDGSGHSVSQGLRQAATLTLHYGNGHTPLDYDHAFVVLNGSLPKGAQVGTRGPYSTQNTTHDASAHTLRMTWGLDTTIATVTATGHAATSAAPQPTGAATTAKVVRGSLLPALVCPPDPKCFPSSTLTWSTYTYVAKFGAPSPLAVDLNAGGLTEGIKIDAPAGPGGTLPNLTLAYNSASVSEQHSPQGAAGWAGEGWNVSMGAISWSQHNVRQNTGEQQWQDSWQLVDPFGTSSNLIPPNTSFSTFYDASPNNPNNTVQPWHTADESHLKIYSMNSNLNIGMPTTPPCFRVFETNGVMEEYGCTSDSLQYYYVPGNGFYIANWFLDLVTSPTGNQVHIGYKTDLVTVNDNGTNYTYARDTVLAFIQYDAPSCYGPQAATTACTGSTAPNKWDPQYEIFFNSGTNPLRRVTTPTGCNTGTNLRCDDPLDLSGSGGLGAPQVQSTLSLNDITVLVFTNNAWNTLRVYDFTYDQSGPATHNDSVTGKSKSTAGKLLLRNVTEVGTNGTTAYPTTSFGYDFKDQWYTDSTFYPYSTGDCGIAWNRGHGGGGDCSLWNTTYEGNRYYLTTIDNGEGVQQTIQWDLARSNTHGVNGMVAANIANPLYCNTVVDPDNYPCDAADDQAWSRAVVKSRHIIVKQLSQAGQGGTQTANPVDSAYGYTYTLNYPLSAQECGDCVAGMYWGSQNDGDYLDYYNGTFMGFAKAAVSNPDGSVAVHSYYAGQGWGVYDTGTGHVTVCNASNLAPKISTCNLSPWWNIANAAHGRETEADYYDTNGTTLLRKVTAAYRATCPPSGVGGSPTLGDGTNWDGNLVAEVDFSNPLATCEVQPTSQTTFVYDGGGSAATSTVSYAHDSYGRVTQTTTTTNGGTPGTPTTVIANTAYVWNDGVNPPLNSGTAVVSGVYLLNQAAFTDTEDNAGHRITCQYHQFDGQAYLTGQQGSISQGLGTATNRYTSCGTSPNFTPTGPLQATAKYDGYGNSQASSDPDANGGATSHTNCQIGGTGTKYTDCQAYDSHAANPTTSTNAANQTTTANYANTAAGGWGLWPLSATDANANTTSMTYDPLGRTLTMSLPGETAASTTSMSYTNWCAATGPQTPCVEEDSTQRLDASTTVTVRSFYDGAHRLVETRTPAPGSQDVVSYTFYDVMGHAIASSSKYFVAAYTGSPGAAAFSLPDTNVTATTMSGYDGLGRAHSSVNPLSQTTTVSYSIVCSPVSGDTGCYEQTLSKDANTHQMGSLTDGLGRAGYSQRYTGTSPYTLYSTTSNVYDAAGRVVTLKYPNGSTATATYDAANRKTASTDPDLGSYTYTYDANGNLLSSVDPRGGAGTYYVCYDGLNRKVGLQTGSSCTTPTGVFASYTYDGGTNGKGHLSGESFTSNGTSGSYAYTYDARGQKTGWTMTLGSNNYAFSFGYNDAGMPLSVTYPGSDVLTAGYTAQGWPSSMTEQQGTTTNQLVSTIAYTGIGGANMQPTSASVGLNLYTYTYGYDGLARTTSSTVKKVSNGTTLFSQARTFDSVGNVITANTTLPQGTDNQAFCYDEQNRLTWAGATGTPSCGRSLTAGSLTAAQYTQTFAYDTLNRLTSGPAGGSYAYGDSTHLDAVTSAGTGYTAGYDPAGDMSCRAPTGSLTCTGTATGQQMGYDQLRRLTSWSNQKTSPTSTAQYAYDGEGQRVQQVAVNSGTTTTTQYIGGLEEISTTGGITTTKKYYAAGVTNVISTNGTLSYTVADGLGSMSASLDGSGNVTADQLFAPYGTTRYTSGAMPTAKAFTGQYQDGSGLAYYNARYYDPAVGQFGSADSVQGNNRYAYVAGNPETATDPTGHDAWWSSSDIGAFTPIQSASINCGDCGGVIAIQPVHESGGGSTGGSGGSTGGSGGSTGGSGGSTGGSGTITPPVTHVCDGCEDISQVEQVFCINQAKLGCYSASEIVAFQSLIGSVSGIWAGLIAGTAIGVAAILAAVLATALPESFPAAKLGLGAGIAALGTLWLVGVDLLSNHSNNDPIGATLAGILEFAAFAALGIGAAIAISPFWDAWEIPGRLAQFITFLYVVGGVFLVVQDIISIRDLGHHITPASTSKP